MISPGDNHPIRNLDALGLSETDRAIFMAIRNVAGLSRMEIARDLNLSKGAVSKALAKLSEAGLVDETRDQPTAGQVGQPAIRIGLRADSVRFVGINLSTRGAYAAVSDLSCRPVWMSLHQPLQASAAAIVAQTVQLVKEALAEAGTGSDIGMFVPAIFSTSEDILEVTPNQAMVPYKEIRQALAATFPDSTLVASSRADLMQSALEPRHFGQVLFHIALADGVGGQIFDRSRIVRGGFNQAGNIGALVPETGPRPSITDLAATLGRPIGALDLAYLEALFAAGDPALLDWIAARSEALSDVLSVVVQLINPHKIILGGNFPKVVLEAFVQSIRLDRYDVPGRMPLGKPGLVVSNVIGEAARALAASTLPLAKYLRFLD